MNDIEINRLIVDAWNFAQNGDDNPALPHIEQLIAAINEVRNERDAVVTTGRPIAEAWWRECHPGRPAVQSDMLSPAVLTAFRVAIREAVARREQP